MNDFRCGERESRTDRIYFFRSLHGLGLEEGKVRLVLLELPFSPFSRRRFPTRSFVSIRFPKVLARSSQSLTASLRLTSPYYLKFESTDDTASLGPSYLSFRNGVKPATGWSIEKSDCNLISRSRSDVSLNIKRPSGISSAEF